MECECVMLFDAGSKFSRRPTGSDGYSANWTRCSIAFPQTSANI